MSLEDKLNQILTFKDSIKQSLLDKGCIDSNTPFTQYGNSLSTALKGDQEYIDKFISTTDYSTTTFYSDAEYVRPYMFFSGGHFSSSKITSINFPNAKVLGAYAFYGLKNVTEIILPEVEYVHAKAFSYMDNLKVVILPKCKVLGWSAMSNCTNLRYVDLPSLTNLTKDDMLFGLETNGVTSTNNGLGAIFSGSGTGMKVWIPSTVTKLGTNSQSNTSNPFYNLRDGGIYTDAVKGNTSSSFKRPDGSSLSWTQYWNYRKTGTSSNMVPTVYGYTHEQFEALRP
jgi:hypothetical protein